MHFPFVLSSLSIFSTLFRTITCLPNTRSLPSGNHNAASIRDKISESNPIAGSVIPFNQSPATPNSPTDSLSIRGANTTNTGIQGRRSHIAYLDFSFLIWSDAHTHLLKTMTAEFRTAAISAANDFALGVKIGAGYGTMIFTYGAFVLIISYVDKMYLLEAILEIFTHVLEAMYPITYSLVWGGLVWFMCYMEGYIDGQRKWVGIPGVSWLA